jgi:hypothetical protein
MTTLTDHDLLHLPQHLFYQYVNEEIRMTRLTEDKIRRLNTMWFSEKYFETRLPDNICFKSAREIREISKTRQLSKQAIQFIIEKCQDAETLATTFDLFTDAVAAEILGTWLAEKNEKASIGFLKIYPKNILSLDEYKSFLT